MIRAALTLMLLAGPAAAQAEGATDAVEALKQCLGESGRALEHPDQFETGLRAAEEFGWTTSETTPGDHRFERDGFTMDIRLRDENGNAQCTVSGPALGPEDAATAADLAASAGIMLPGTKTHPSPPDVFSRVYYLHRGPSTFGVRSYKSDEGAVELYFINFPPPPPEGQNPEIHNTLSAAIDLCHRPGIDAEQRAYLLRSSGFDEEVSYDEATDITRTNFIRAGVMVVLRTSGPLSDCAVLAASANVSQMASLADQIIPRLYPTFRRGVTHAEDGSYCVSYWEPDVPNATLIWVSSARGDFCADDGTSGVYLSDPG